MSKVIHIGRKGGWTDEVEFRADLPINPLSPPIGSVYLVKQKTTILAGIWTTYQSGLYIRDFSNGNLNDWRRLNFKVKFSTSEFALVDTTDESKQAKFDLTLITTATTRTYIKQDRNGTDALLDNILKQKADTVLKVSFSGNPKKYSVVFATAYPDTNYSIAFSILSTLGLSITIENKLATGFDINLNRNNINGLTSVDWTCTKHGEAL